MKNLKKTKFQFLQFSLVFSTFLFVLSILFINCGNEIKENTFTISTWTGAGKEFIQKNSL